MKTSSFRLDDKELKRIEKLAEEEGQDKSRSVRELLDYGWEYMMIRKYKEGKLSLSRLSQELEQPISEVIDLLADLGVESPIEKDEVMEGYRTLKKDY